MNIEDRIAESSAIWKGLAAASGGLRIFPDSLSETGGTYVWVARRAMEVFARHEALSASPEPQKPPIPKAASVKDNVAMSDPLTRPELDAKLETIEAKMDGRLARIEDAVQRISDDNAATRAGISSLKTTLIVTTIGAVLTIVLGVAAFNATLQSNMLSAFQVGQQTSQQK